jgi:hypothetical protein
MLRNALWAVLGLSAFLMGSCADGAEEPQNAGDAQICSATCGNTVIDMPESCDGFPDGTIVHASGVPATCASLGMGTGVVTCDPCLCTYRVDMCTSTGSGGMGGGGSALTGSGGVGGGI